MVELPGWPRLPFDWPHHEPLQRSGARECCIDTVDGRCVRAFALDVTPGLRKWRIAFRDDGPIVVLPLARVARVTLSAPLRAGLASLEHGLARIPVRTHECDYTLRTATGQHVLRGRTVGHADTDDGIYLFAAQAGELALNRVFVPRASRVICEFGATASGGAAAQWIKDPATLRAALSSRRARNIPRIGEALEQLGFVTARQIEYALAQTNGHDRLGERLLRQGLIKPEQLQMALAFKLSFPFVDLARFPIDSACARLLSHELASRHCAVPVLLDGRQIVVVVDGPSTLRTLEALNPWPDHIVTPAFAPRGAILMTLSARRGDDAWAQEVPWR